MSAVRYLKIFPALLIGSILILLPVFAGAQATRCTISGRVVDVGQNPLGYAAVALYDSLTPRTGVITDGNGRFSLKTQRSEKTCRLTVEFIGYEKFEQTITPNRSRLELGAITLRENAISLGEVVVAAREVARKSSVEHTTIHASAAATANSGTAIDILRSSPSVTLSGKEVSIRGNSNILLLIDGIPTSTDDLSVLPAANIKSIEVITNPDASHDAAGTGGIINIISRKGLAEGLSGIVSANYGFNHFVTGNVALSGNSPRIAWRFSYQTRYEDNEIHSSLNRMIRTSGLQTLQRMQSMRYTSNNNVNLGADIRISKRDRLGIDVKGLFPRLNVRQELHNRFSAGSKAQEFRNNDVTWNRENIEAAISYTRILRPEISQISFRGSLSKTWGHRPSFYSTDGELSNRSVSGGSPFVSSLQGDYRLRFKNGSFSAGFKLTFRSNDIFHQFYSATNGGWTYSEALSNDLRHTETIPALYAVFDSKIGRKFNLKAGLRGEFSSVSLDSRHEQVNTRNNLFFLAPSLTAIYSPSDRQELAFAFSRRIGRPSYPQLNPYLSMVDATTYEQGNMFLEPERASKFDLSYTLRGAALNLFADGYANYTHNYISQITTFVDERLVTTYVNADSDLKTGVELSLRIVPVRWLNLSIGANTWYSLSKGRYKGVRIDNRGWTNNSNLMLDFALWKGGTIQLQYFLTTPRYYPQLTRSLTHRMDLGLKQRLMNKTMTLSLLITDVLNTSQWEVTSCNNLFELSNLSKDKSRMVWLGVSYNFNSFKQRKGRKAESDRSLIRLGL